MKILNNLNLSKNELQNAVVHNLASAPSNPVKGQEYFDTTENKKFIWDGTSWVDETNQGKIYTFQNGVKELTGNDAGKVELDIASGANAGNVTLTANSNGLSASVAEASTSAKGIIEIATDEEASTGTSEVLAVNPKQLATKVTGNNAITGNTKTKITYDSKGLVTAGADLEASDIPSLTLSKISDVTATAAEVNVLDGITASTAELNILDGVTATASEINVLDGITATTTELNYVNGVTSAIQTQLDSKLAKKPDGTNDLISDNKVSTTYLPDFLLGQVFYGGTVNASTGVATLTTNAKSRLGTTSNTITLTNDTTAITGYEANEGIYYIVSDNGTFASTAFLTGDWLISIGSAWKKIDNTDAVTGVKGNSESSYRIGNVNITATNIGVDEGAQVNVMEGLQVDGTDVTLTSKKANLVSGSNITMSVSGNAITINASATTRKYSVDNPALTQSSGLCTWTVTHSLNTKDVVVGIEEVSSGDAIMADITKTSADVVTIKIVSASDISAGTYRVTVIG